MKINLTKRVFVLFFFIILFNKTYSCDCSVKPQIDSAVKKSDIIFSGVVIDVKKIIIVVADSGIIIDPDSSQLSNALMKGSMTKYTFCVGNWYKNKVSSKFVYIYSFTSENMCGYLFKKGEDYIVYAMEDEYYEKNEAKKHYSTNMCTRTELVSLNAIKELKRTIRKSR